MPKRTVGIQPSILRWARESAGYSVEQVAGRIKRSPAEVAAWESGAGTPTYPQLERLAYQVYKRPLATFFLPEPPQEPALRQEFRTLPEFELSELAPDTRYRLRFAQALQLSLYELNDGVNPAEHKLFHDIGLDAEADIRRSASRIRKHLGVTVTMQASWKSTDEALKEWRNLIQDHGVFVFKHAFKQREISGFCLTDPEFPLIYLNNSSAKTRQIFSLFHELAHVLLHVNAISKWDQSYVGHLPRREQRIERFCNAIAAEILMPSDDFARLTAGIEQVDEAVVEKLAKRYHVSRESVLRRFLDQKSVDQAFYESVVRRWAAEADKTEPGRESRGNYYATQATYLGERYLRLVFSRHYQGRLSLEQVADYLGVRTRTVAGLETFMLHGVAPS